MSLKKRRGRLTSVEESSGRTHSPLTLIHAGNGWTAHLHADFRDLLRLQRAHHHHVHVTKLISSDVLQTHTRRPRLWTCKNTHAFRYRTAPFEPNRMFISADFVVVIGQTSETKLTWNRLSHPCFVSSMFSWTVCQEGPTLLLRSSRLPQKTSTACWCWDSQSHNTHL